MLDKKVLAAGSQQQISEVLIRGLLLNWFLNIE